jgi:uncharacterized protein (TIGR02594 family)
MKAYELAKAEVGTVEWAEGSNPKVVAYYRDAGHPEVKDDAVAWCAAFVGAMLKRAGMPNTGLLTARSYLKWGDGVNLDQARPGDVVVFKRGNSTWEGHVAFFVKQNGTNIEVLGGNQRDAVNISRYPVSQLLGIRRMAASKPTAAPQKPASAPVAPAAPADTPQPFKGFLGALLRLLWSLLPKGR